MPGGHALTVNDSEQAMRIDAPTLVREAAIGDATAVGEVHATALLTAYQDLLEQDLLTELAQQRRQLWTSLMGTPEFARTTLLVAERGHRIVAFAHFGPHADSPVDAELYSLYAHPSVWGCGVAGTLLDNAWDLLVAAAYPRVRVWTVGGANRAHRFYTRFGFTETGRRREHDYGDGRPVLQVEYTHEITREHPAPQLPTQRIHQIGDHSTALGEAIYRRQITHAEQLPAPHAAQSRPR
jgi:GNAT superfamily N-acetyltransferase